MSAISLSFMQRFMGKLDTAIRNFVDAKIADKVTKPTILNQTLLAGDTSVTFTGIPTTGTNKITICTSKAGLNYASLDDSTAGQITITYEAQNVPVTVYVMIEGGLV